MDTSRNAKHCGRRVKEIIGIAHEALEHLEADSPQPETWPAQIEGLIQRSFPLASSPAVTNKSAELDQAGVALWNASTSLLRRSEDPRRRPSSQQQQQPLIHQAALLRTFACLLLDASYSSSSRCLKNPQQRVRTFKITLKAVRFCLEHNELPLTQKTLERCSDYAIAVEEATPVIQPAGEGEGTNSDVLLKRLAQEYYLLRVMHSWKSDRLDLAEHFYNKTRTLIGTDLAGNAAELYHVIGTSLMKQQVLPQAKSWLGRAAETLEACNVEQEGVDLSELRLATTASQVQCLLLSNDVEERRGATTMIDALETTYGLGNRVAVSLMRFDVCIADEPVDIPFMRSTLLRMLKLGVMTEQTFKIFMKTIHRANKLHTPCACGALADLITARLLPIWQPDEMIQGQDQQRPCSTQEWLEKAIVTYVLFATSSSDSSIICTMADLFDTVRQTVTSGISAKATHAAQTLIWKASGAPASEKAMAWSTLLQHPLFDNAGLMNRARIARKAILNALHRDDLDAARSAYHSMQPGAQAEPLTQYIAFKLALKSDDYDLAKQSLDSIVRQAGKDPSYLYACTLEATQSGTTHMAVAALRAIAQALPSGTHTPSLLRCIARLLIAEIGQPGCSLDDALPPVVELFENALRETKGLRKDSEAQWRSEIQWWSKNAYNLALRVCGDVQPGGLIILLEVCVRFLECWPKDGGVMLQDDINNRKLLCHFLSASASVTLGRSNPQDKPTSLQSYTHVRQQVCAFNTTLSQSAPQISQDLKTQSRAFEMLKYDLESILHLQHWHDLNSTLEKCLDFSSLDRWDTLADIVIIIHEQTKNKNHNTSTNAAATAFHIPDLLQKIVNTTWKREKNMIKLSRWVRLTFTMYLDSDSDFNARQETEKISLKLLHQAAGMASRGCEGRGQRYPEDELGWLATTAFNKAVDFLALGDQGVAREWVEGALELARWADDGGELHSILTHHRELAEERVRVGVV